MTRIRTKPRPETFEADRVVDTEYARRTGKVDVTLRVTKIRAKPQPETFEANRVVGRNDAGGMGKCTFDMPRRSLGGCAGDHHSQSDVYFEALSE